MKYMFLLDIELQKNYPVSKSEFPEINDYIRLNISDNTIKNKLLIGHWILKKMINDPISINEKSLCYCIGDFVSTSAANFYELL